MSETQSQKQPLPLWRRIVMTLIILAMIGLLVSMLVNFIVKNRLESRIAAVKESGYPVSFQQLIQSSDTPRQKDAADLYKSYLSILKVDDINQINQIVAYYRNAIAANTLDKLPENFQPSIANNLAMNKALMKNLDKAASMPLASYDLGLQTSDSKASESLSQVQKAVLLLSIRTKYLIASKNYDQAADSIITMLKTTRVLDRSLIIPISADKQRFLQSACDDARLLLQGKPSDAAIDKLIKAFTEELKQDTVKSTLLAEQVLLIENIRNLISKKTADKLLQKNIPELPKRLILPKGSFGQIKLRLFFMNYFNEMDKLIQASSKPPYQFLEFITEQKKNMSEKTLSIFAASHNFAQISSTTSVLLKSTVLMLNIEKFRRANAGIPESLAEISANIDPAVMTDPFTGSGLLYKNNDQSYTVYSTGPDKVDNGGSVTHQISLQTGKIEKMPEDIGMIMPIKK